MIHEDNPVIKEIIASSKQPALLEVTPPPHTPTRPLTTLLTNIYTALRNLYAR